MTLGERIGKALALSMGDMRDWPPQCGWCGSEAVSRSLPVDFERHHLRCAECGHLTSRAFASDEQYRRACREVYGRDTPPRIGFG